VLNNTKTQSRPKLLFLYQLLVKPIKVLKILKTFLSRPRPWSWSWQKSLENFQFNQDFYHKTKPRPRLWVSRPRPRPRLDFLSSRRLETKTLVSRTTSLAYTTAQGLI